MEECGVVDWNFQLIKTTKFVVYRWIEIFLNFNEKPILCGQISKGQILCNALYIQLYKIASDVKTAENRNFM